MPEVKTRRKTKSKGHFVWEPIEADLMTDVFRLEAQAKAQTEAAMLHDKRVVWVYGACGEFGLRCSHLRSA